MKASRGTTSTLLAIVRSISPKNPLAGFRHYGNRTHEPQLWLGHPSGDVVVAVGIGAFALALSISSAANASPAAVGPAVAALTSAGASAVGVADAGRPEIPVELVTSANGSYPAR